MTLFQWLALVEVMPTPTNPNMLAMFTKCKLPVMLWAALCFFFPDLILGLGVTALCGADARGRMSFLVELWSEPSSILIRPRLRGPTSFVGQEVGLADGAYSGNNRLIAPFRHKPNKSLPPSEERYNMIHSFFRSRIEHARTATHSSGSGSQSMVFGVWPS